MTDRSECMYRSRVSFPISIPHRTCLHLGTDTALYHVVSPVSFHPCNFGLLHNLSPRRACGNEKDTNPWPPSRSTSSRSSHAMCNRKRKWRFRQSCHYSFLSCSPLLCLYIVNLGLGEFVKNKIRVFFCVFFSWMTSLLNGSKWDLVTIRNIACLLSFFILFHVVQNYSNDLAFLPSRFNWFAWNQDYFSIIFVNQDLFYEQINQEIFLLRQINQYVWRKNVS